APAHVIAAARQGSVPLAVPRAGARVVVDVAAVGFDHELRLAPEEIDLESFAAAPQRRVAFRYRQAGTSEEWKKLCLHPAADVYFRLVSAPGLELPLELACPAAPRSVEDRVDPGDVQGSPRGRFLDQVAQRLPAEGSGVVNDRARRIGRR